VLGLNDPPARFLILKHGQKGGKLHSLKLFMVKGMNWNKFVKLGHTALRTQLTLFQVRTPAAAIVCLQCSSA